MTTQNDGRADALRRELLQRRLLKASQERQASGQQVIERADRSAPLPLSWSQQRLWFLNQLDPAAGAAYHLASAARLSGTLDRDALQAALDRIVFRHESLRSRFVTLGDTPVQVIDAPETGFTLIDHDLSCDDITGREERVADMAAAEASAHFDLSNGPLVRGRLLRLAENEHVLLVTQHHIVSDGWSMGVFIHELQAQYAAAVVGNDDPLSPLPLQYADYATWQRGWLKHDALAHQVDFWRNHLANAPALIGLPTDRPRPAVQSFRGETVAVHIPAALTSALKQLSKRHGTTLFMTLLTGWATLLSRWSGQSDLVIGTPVANRSRPELEPMIGFFVNTLAMRIRLDGKLSVAALLAHVRATALGVYSHQDVPFDQVVEAVRPARSLSHGPLFQVMLSLNNTFGGEPRALGGLVLEPLQIAQGTTHFDLSLALAERAGEICGVAQFASDLFDADSVKRHVAAFSTVLSAMVADDSQPIIELPVMEEPERKQLLVDFNPPAPHAAPAPLLHREFENQVERSPGSIAVKFKDTSLTYAELDCRANQLAHALRAQGAGPDLRVALCVERGVDMIVGVLGILKAGAAYVPLDPAYPDARLAYLLQDSNPLALVTQSSLHERLATLAPSLPVMDLQDASLRNLSTQPPVVPGLEAHHLAYVIYTSGSTGQPKGVMVEHGNIVHLWLGLRSEVFDAMEATLRVALNASYSFDASMQMIVQLLSGHCLILVPEVLRSNGDAMVRFLARHRVDVLDCTPAQLELMLDAGLCNGSTYAPVAVLVGGDAIPDALWKRMVEAKTTRFFNVYGPTECTVDATLACVDQTAMQPHIGRPLANTRIYVLDGRGQPVPIGTVGEIHIGGAQVARGYLDRPDLTSERFRVDPFIDTPSARLYRTGDLARWRADGTLQYLGRNDSQVKIRGFRIEPGEIESQLVSCGGIAEAVVIAREDLPGDRRLVAYVRAEAGQEIVAADLRDRLLSRLAPHMVPSAFVQIEAWPLTHNGKLDRSALPAPNAASIALRAYQAPDGHAEHAVAATWQAVLGVEGIGRQDNFFELGGHSLLVVAVIERLRQQGLHAEVRSLFTAPTLAGFAATLGTGSLTLDAPDYALDAQGRITPQHLPLVALEQEQIDALVGTIREGTPSIQDIYPLGPLQQGVLFHSLLDSEGDPYLMRTIMRFDEGQRLHSFLTALDQVIARHDVLRSSIHWEGLPTPVQVVHRQARMPVEALHLANGDAEAQLRDLIDPGRMRLDLGQAPLVRAFTAADPHGNGHWLVLLSHHIVCDHVTLELLMQEVRTLLYDPSTPLPIVLPYRNFIASTLASSESAHESYFRAQLADVLEPTAPFGVLDVRGNGRDLTEFTMALSDSLSQKLRHHARLLGVTPAAFFHLAWGLVLARCCERDDVVFGTVLSGRLQGVNGADQLLGMFINTLPVRIHLGGRGVRAAVMETHARLSELLDHEQASLAVAQRCSGVSAELPLFTSLLNYRHNVVATDTTWPGVHFVRGEERTNFPLVMSINDSGRAFSMTAQAVVGLDPHRLSGWLAQGLESLAHALEQRHDLPVLKLELAAAEESIQRQQALLATTRAYPRDGLIHHVFQEQVRAQPEAVAADFHGATLSYQQLDRRANQVAQVLRANGAGPDRCVAICSGRRLEFIVGLLGILKAGAAYVPLDPDYPVERLGFMLEDCQPVAVLTWPEHHARIQTLVRNTPVIALDDPRFDAAPIDVPDVPGLGSQHLAYVMYTSGSTGQPKGVMVEHRNVLRLAINNGFASLGPSDVVAHCANPAFDAATWEIWGALLVGARVQVVAEQVALDPVALDQALRAAGVTALWLTAGLFNAHADALTDAFAGLRYLLVGGDVLDPDRIGRVLAQSTPPQHLLNGYGPTESTTFASTHLIEQVEPGRSIPIGRPIGNTQIHLLAPDGQPVLPGVIGEVYIGGDGVARGYLNQPELSAERFLADPYRDDPSARLYRSGDLARWLDDGTLEFIGRTDFQLKLRGYRIEPGEIETHLRTCAGVREAVVIAREDTPGDKRLVAYVLAEGQSPPAPELLRAHLAQKLADYMLPSAFVTVPHWPLTSNGKLDRRALPAPDIAAVVAGRYEAPVGEVEQALATLWQEVLGLERVGRGDDFFALGGNSLLAIQMVSRARQLQICDTTLGALFEQRTLRHVVQAAKELQAPDDVAIIPLADRAMELPLSWSQQRLWFLDQLDKAAGAAYHIPVAMRLTGVLDARALQRALNRIVARHESLRTRFENVNGAPRQIIESIDSGFVLTHVDLSNLTTRDRDAEVARLIVQETREPFQLSQGPLIRGQLFHLAEHHHLLLITQHHIVSDGWSMGLFIQELGALYTAFTSGNEDPLTPLALQYADYAAWQRGWLQGTVLDAQLAFWRSHLEGAPTLIELPLDRPRPMIQRYHGGKVGVHLPASLIAAVKRLSHRHGATLHMTLLAAWSIVLSRISGQADVVIGTPVANRPRTELEPMIGFFVNSLALRVRLENDPSVAALLGQIKATTLAAYAHQDVPFEQVVEAIKPLRSLAHSPVFQVMLALDNTPSSAPTELPELELASVPIGHTSAQFDLSLSLAEQGEELVGALEYASDLFDADTARRMTCYFESALAAMVADDQAQASRIRLQSKEEYQQALHGFGAAHRSWPQQESIVRLFEHSAARRPNAVALTFGTKTLCYGELNARANQLAHVLRARGAGPEQRVALCMERGFDLVVGMLGILKSGAAYVPMEPSAPPERLAFMLIDSAPMTVVTQSDLVARFQQARRPLLVLDADAELNNASVQDPCNAQMTPRHLAYVIYTSGSTGQPKGVMVEHGQVARLFAATDAQFQFGSEDVWTLFHSFAFDFSVWEIWGALLHGGRLVIVPAAVSRSPRDFHALLIEQGVTVLNQTPSAFRQLIAAEADSTATHRLRYVIFGGEALDLPMLAPWIARNDPDQTQLINMYGITEITVHATFRRIERRDVQGGQGSLIGRPLSDLRILVLDSHQQPVPIGVTGELYVGGDGIARGYLNRPELTAERFLPDPYSSDPSARLYRTGDLGRWLPGGELQYVGRNDFQVKIRGFRIELAEIEARLQACDGVREAVVLAREDSPGDKRLVGYVITEPDSDPSAAELRDHLLLHLADYMVPAAFVRVHHWPLTSNGKLDRAALPAPDASAVAARGYEAPVGETELAIAAVWQEVLGLEQVGRHDNFFELGGHSLLVITVIEQLRHRGLYADVKSVFTSPTPSTLAHLLGDRANGAFVVPENRIPDAALADDNMEEFLI